MDQHNAYFYSNASYNANAEKRIDDLIQKAIDGDEDISVSNQSLISAGHILEKEFNSHPWDSRELNTMRIKNKMRIYDKILGAYDEIIPQIPIENALDDHDKELEKI